MVKPNIFLGRRKKYRILGLAATVGGVVIALTFIVKQVVDSTSYQEEAKEAAQLVPIDPGLNNLIEEWDKQVQAELGAFIPTRFQGQTLKEVKLPSNEKVIALTFDDGPWPKTTEQILKILKQNNVKATFFLLGQPLQAYPHLGKLVVKDGHAVTNHTWNHWYRKMDSATAASEIDKTAELIYKTTGVKTSIFRPPGGILNNGVVDYAKKKKYFIALWSADSTDYNRVTAPTMVKKVLKEAQPGGMVLMHDGGGDRTHTVKALPQIIKELKKRGYKFVTVPELLEMQDKELNAKKTAE